MGVSAQQLMTNETIHYREMEANDAPALQSLVERCYGDSYFDALYFDADELRKAIEKQQLRSCIALNERGEIIAHLGMRHAEASLTSDSSLAIVDPLYRAKGLLVETGMRLCEICIDMGLCGIYGTAVTVHTYSQQSNLRGGAGVTGVYLNYIPAGTLFLEVDEAKSESPTPSILMLAPLAIPPVRSCYMPARYNKQIREAFDDCNMQRELLANDTLSLTDSVIKVSYKPRQKVCYYWVDVVGSDLREQILSQIDLLKAQTINAFYIHLPLDQQGLDESIEALRDVGFFYGGLLPEASQRDWLILQYITGVEPDWSSVQLSGERSRVLLDFILADREDVK